MLKVKSLFVAIFMGLATLGLAAGTAQAVVTLNVNGDGLLTGASNVNLGSLGVFNVAFVDGTCVGILTGCDNAVDDFTFQSEADARIAALALLAQVLVGDFDTDPSKVLGCGPACFSMVAFRARDTGQFDSVAAFNDPLNSLDGDSIIELNPIQTTVGDDKLNFALFSSPVPEPTTLALFGIGLLGLAGMRRRRKAV